MFPEWLAVPLVRLQRVADCTTDGWWTLDQLTPRTGRQRGPVAAEVQTAADLGAVQIEVSPSHGRRRYRLTPAGALLAELKAAAAEHLASPQASISLPPTAGDGRRRRA
ncbi:hypothetical protein [Frankia sp. AvcI1]|uniref:hypothetical protein n=1 Tax=Frankia sp. AvcI1 TaxID=573496 RepID=UPI0006EBE6EF|nr:hypothetical protein [Frankia sp. AvcI1]